MTGAQTRLLALAAVGAAAAFSAGPALAQTTSGAGGNIGSFIQNVVDILNNNVVRGLAVIAVIITGISWMFSIVDLRRAGTVILGIIVIFSASTIVGLVTGSGFGLVSSRRRPLHGSARFAREAELRREDLRARDGVLLGTKGGRMLSFGGTEHVLLYAPTRSGIDRLVLDPERRSRLHAEARGIVADELAQGRRFPLARRARRSSPSAS